MIQFIPDHLVSWSERMKKFSAAIIKSCFLRVCGPRVSLGKGSLLLNSRPLQQVNCLYFVPKYHSFEFNSLHWWSFIEMKWNELNRREEKRFYYYFLFQTEIEIDFGKKSQLKSVYTLAPLDQQSDRQTDGWPFTGTERLSDGMKSYAMEMDVKFIQSNQIFFTAV